MRIIKQILAVSILALTAIGTSSCYIRISKEAKEEIKDRIRFKTEMNEVVYDKTDSLKFSPGVFTAMENNSALDVNFIQSDGEPRVVVTGTYKSRDSVRVENIDGTLHIGYKTGNLGIFISHDEEVTVFAPAIAKLVNKGSGDVAFLGTYEGGGLEILNIGSGDFMFDNSIIDGPLSLTNQGSGDIDFGNTRIDGSLTIANKGSGDVVIKGKAGDTVVTNQGSGDVDISKLETLSIDVTSKGSGEVKRR